MNYVIVGLGGILGSLIRFSLGRFVSERSKSTFPTGTAIINITGAILLGTISTMNLPVRLYLFLGDGFLGAYTTFSTFMYEGFNLFQQDTKLNAFTYIIITILLGLIGYTIGTKLGLIL